MALSSTPALILAVAMSAFFSCGSANADTLLIQTVDAAATSAAERPRTGSSMAAVEARFGAPASRSAAVGQPPITRWDYPGFVVYFEHDHVIHAVRR